MEHCCGFFPRPKSLSLFYLQSCYSALTLLLELVLPDLVTETGNSICENKAKTNPWVLKKQKPKIAYNEQTWQL